MFWLNKVPQVSSSRGMRNSKQYSTLKSEQGMRRYKHNSNNYKCSNSKCKCSKCNNTIK